jgi:antitoxin component of MazEF toxin-antitoxin module
MRERIIRTESGLGVSLPEEALEALGVDEGAEVSVEIQPEGRRIIVMPAGAAAGAVDPEFARQVPGFIAEYRAALEALARA